MNVLITGAVRGLGACLVKAFLNEGHRVFALVLPGQGSGELAEVENNPLLSIFSANLQSPADMARVHGEVLKLTDHMDITLNVAGVLLNKNGLITENSYEELENTFRVNTIAPIHMNNLFLDMMRKSAAPAFLNICSEVRTIDDVGDWFPAYCISKTALTQYCFSLRATFQKTGFEARVFAIHPGRMSTAMGGENSEITPETSAAGILLIATGAVLADNRYVYVNYQGEPMLKD